MKALILAAGYATRMYPLTKDKAKPLLPVAGKPMINHILDHIEKIEEIDKVYVVTNQKFSKDFQKWAEEVKSTKEIIVINDGTKSDKDKLGAIGDVHFVVKQAGIDDDLLIVGGDNLFDFDIKVFVDFFKSHGNTVALYELEDKEEIKRYNEVKFDENNRIYSFREKPEDPETNCFVICLYLYNRKGIRLLDRYVENGSNPDAPGYFVEWLHKQTDVYGVALAGNWYDIGNLEVYEQVNKEFRSRK